MIKFQKHREMEFRGLLIELIKLLQPEVYCEIGVKKGYTFNAIAPLVKISIGIDPASWELKENTITSQWIPNQNGYRKIRCKMTSNQFAPLYHDWVGMAKIDFLFIDGDHSREQLRKDLMNYIPFVQEDTGMIFLHDTYPTNEKLAVKEYCHNAWEVANEIYDADIYSGWPKESHISDQERFYLEIVTVPGPWAGMSILRKRSKDRHMHWQYQ